MQRAINFETNLYKVQLIPCCKSRIIIKHWCQNQHALKNIYKPTCIIEEIHKYYSNECIEINKQFWQMFFNDKIAKLGFKNVYCNKLNLGWYNFFCRNYIRSCDGTPDSLILIYGINSSIINKNNKYFCQLNFTQSIIIKKETYNKMFRQNAKHVYVKYNTVILDKSDIILMENIHMARKKYILYGIMQNSFIQQFFLHGAKFKLRQFVFDIKTICKYDNDLYFCS